MTDDLSRRDCIKGITATGLVTLSAGCADSIQWSEIENTIVSNPVHTVKIEDTSGLVRLSAEYKNTYLELVTIIIDESNEEIVFPPLTSENPVQDSMSVLTPGARAIDLNSDSDLVEIKSPDPIQFVANEESTYRVILSPVIGGIELDDLSTHNVLIEAELQRTGLFPEDENVVSVDSEPTQITDLQATARDLLVTDSTAGEHEGFIGHFRSNELNHRERNHYFGAFVVLAEAHRQLYPSREGIKPLWNQLVAADIRATAIKELTARANQLLDLCILVIKLKYNPPESILDAVEKTLRDQLDQMTSFQIPIEDIEFTRDGTATAPTQILIEADVSSPLVFELNDLELSIATPPVRFPLNYSETRWEMPDFSDIARNEAKELINDIDAFFDYTSTEEETPTEESNNTRLAEQAVEIYKEGLNDQESANQRYSNGDGFYEQADYIAAAEQYEESAELGSNAAVHYSSAADAASEMPDRDGAVSLAQESSKSMELATSIAFEVANQARDAEEYGENSREVDEHKRKVDELFSELEKYDVAELSEFKTALGLD